ncbi:unnamed protein product [Acanthoscelides obtectus]|uniref:Uncharacterized protein n=1 Tax=Acanthoscelides obtectus TaxID=200917 RepID=A0A9P0QFV2_ACAOB|nr:unnamed protein product [Acanthoscelides obtectus]CAK1689364.1 hypothetical protein AOBTE_LOCUS37193 [Acanthoscelides obtectus]
MKLLENVSKVFRGSLQIPCMGYMAKSSTSRYLHQVTTAEEDWKCRLHPPALPTDEITWICSECGDWMCKPSVELPKINMTLHEALQNPVLGISEPLCDDLVNRRQIAKIRCHRTHDRTVLEVTAGDFFLPLLNTLPKKFDPTTFKTLREFRPALKRHKDKDSNEGTPEKQFKPSSSEPQPSTSTATDESKNQLSEESSHKHTQGKNKNVSGHCSIPATKSTKNHYAEAYASDTKIIKVNSSNQGSTSKLPERNQYSALIGTEITAALSANATSAGKPNQRGGTSDSQVGAIPSIRTTSKHTVSQDSRLTSNNFSGNSVSNASYRPAVGTQHDTTKFDKPTTNQQDSASSRHSTQHLKRTEYTTACKERQNYGSSAQHLKETTITTSENTCVAQYSGCTSTSGNQLRINNRKKSSGFTPDQQSINSSDTFQTASQHSATQGDYLGSASAMPISGNQFTINIPELQAEVPAASLVKTTAKEVSLPQPREHQGSSSKSVLRSKAEVSPIPVNVVTLPIPVVPPGSTPRVKTLSILQIVPPRTTNARAVPQPPSVSPHSTTRLTSPPVVQKMTVKRQILDMPQQIAYVTQQEVSHVVARDMTQQELTSAKPQEVSLTLKDMAQQDLQSTSQNIREPSPSNSQTLTEAGTRGMDRLIQAARNFDARQKEKHNITVQKQRIQAGNLQDTQLILQASLEMKCTLQEVGQGQPSSSTQAASLQKDIPIVSPMKTHQILTEIYPWLEGSRLSTPSPEFAQLVQQITTEVHNPSTLQEDSPVQQIETSPPQLPLEDLMDQLSSLQETDPTSPDINPPRSLPEELFQIENLDHLVSHITQKTNSMPTTPPQESHKLPVEMNLRLQQEISPSPTLLGSSSLHAMEKDHLPPQPICHKVSPSIRTYSHRSSKTPSTTGHLIMETTKMRRCSKSNQNRT